NQKLDSVVELINQNPVYNVSIKYRTSDGLIRNWGSEFQILFYFYQ
ncbi:MAG: hypothetical protein ACJAS9_003812, partial [Polaribacter sp.]